MPGHSDKRGGEGPRPHPRSTTDRMAAAAHGGGNGEPTGAGPSISGGYDQMAPIRIPATSPPRWPCQEILHAEAEDGHVDPEQYQQLSQLGPAQGSARARKAFHNQTPNSPKMAPDAPTRTSTGFPRK